MLPPVSSSFAGKQQQDLRVLQQHHHQTTPPLPPTTSSRTTSEYPAHKTHTRVTKATEVEQNTAQQWEQQQSSSSSRQDGRAFAWNPRATPYQPLAGEEDDQLLLWEEQQWQQQWQAAAWYTGWEQQPQQQQQQGYEQPAITHPHHFGVPPFSLPPPSTTTEPFTTHDMSAWLNQVGFWTALMQEAAAAASTASDSNGAYHTSPMYQQYQPEYEPEDLLHFQQQQQHQPHHHEDQPEITRCLPAWLTSAVQTSLPLQLEYVVQYENQADNGDDSSSSRVGRFLASSWRQGLAESRWEGSWQGSEPHEYEGVDYSEEPSDEHRRHHHQQQGVRRRGGYVRPRVATEADKNVDDDDAEGMWLDLGDVDRMRWSGVMNAIRDDEDEADPGAERRRPFATLASWERNWPIPEGDIIWGMYWG